MCNPNGDHRRSAGYAGKRILRTGARSRTSRHDGPWRGRTEAVLETLGETLTGDEAENVATQLPDDHAGIVEDADHDVAGYDRTDFVDRVGERLRGTDVVPDDAEQYADALAVALTNGELQDLKSQLDDRLDPLFEGVTIGRENV